MNRVQIHKSFSHSISRARKREIEKSKRNLLKRYQTGTSPPRRDPPTPKLGFILSLFSWVGDLWGSITGGKKANDQDLADLRNDDQVKQALNKLYSKNSQFREVERQVRKPRDFSNRRK